MSKNNNKKGVEVRKLITYGASVVPQDIFDYASPSICP
jgi:hypothetical protein